MKLLEKLDKAILDMKTQQYGFALSTLMQIRAQLTPEFEIGERVTYGDRFDIEEFNSQAKINDVLFSIRDDHFYYSSPDWDFILPADDIEKFGDENETT